MANTEHMMGYIEELTSKGFDANLGILDFSKMLQLIQGYLLEVEAVTEKKQIDDAVDMALDAVNNQCNVFQGHGRRISCMLRSEYEESRGSRRSDGCSF